MKAMGAVSGTDHYLNLFLSNNHATDTYSDDELIRGSMWFIRSTGTSKLQIYTGVRDRAMLLVSTTTAYRGDNTRRITWSDLKLKQVTLLDVGPDVKEHVHLKHRPKPVHITDKSCLLGASLYIQSRQDKYNRSSG